MFLSLLAFSCSLQATGLASNEDLSTVSLTVSGGGQAARKNMVRRELRETKSNTAVFRTLGGPDHQWGAFEGFKEAAKSSSSEAAVHTSPCRKNQAAYAVLSDGNLAIIDLGPITTSGQMEVQRLTQTSNYKSFIDTVPVDTHMQLVAEDDNNGEWTFLADGADNLLAITDMVTDSNMTEVHRLKFGYHGYPYQEFDINIVTALPVRSSFDERDILLDSESNLVVIWKGPSTESSMTELYKMSANKSWQEYAKFRVRTGMHLSSSTSQYGEWTFLLDGADNLICISLPTASYQAIVVKRLTKPSIYQAFDILQGGALLPTHSRNADAHAYTDYHWVFTLDPSDDLLCILEGPVTVNGRTEVHKLSMASNYTEFTLHQNNTDAPCREPRYDDAASVR